MKGLTCRHVQVFLILLYHVTIWGCWNHLKAHVLGMNFQMCANMQLQMKRYYWSKLHIYEGCPKCHPKIYYMAQKIRQGQTNMG
jgi:hypothetical protein